MLADPCRCPEKVLLVPEIEASVKVLGCLSDKEHHQDQCEPYRLAFQIARFQEMPSPIAYEQVSEQFKQTVLPERV